MTIVVGIVSICVMCSQRNIEYDIMTLQQYEHQPIFEFELVPGSVGDSVNGEMFEELEIRNIGEKVKQYDEIKLNSFLEIESYADSSQLKEFQTIIIPIDYFGFLREDKELQGYVCRTLGSDAHANIDNYFKLVFSQYSNRNIKYDIEDVHHLVYIEYTDIYGDELYACLLDGEEIDAKLFLDYCKKIQESNNVLEKENPHQSRSIDKLDIEKITNMVELLSKKE